MSDVAIVLIVVLTSPIWGLLAFVGLLCLVQLFGVVLTIIILPIALIGDAVEGVWGRLK